MIRPASQRKAMLRDQRRNERIPDPLDPTGETLIHPGRHVPHGTEAGYTEYGCGCTDLGNENAPIEQGGPAQPWGCKQAGVRAAADRKVRRRIRRLLGRAEASN